MSVNPASGVKKPILFKPDAAMVYLDSRAKIAFPSILAQTLRPQQTPQLFASRRPRSRQTFSKYQLP
jgi:hypothetical protein